MTKRGINFFQQTGTTLPCWIALTVTLFCSPVCGQEALERFRAATLMRESTFENLSMKCSVDQKRHVEKDADTGAVTVSEGPVYDISYVLTNESKSWFNEQMKPRSQDADRIAVEHSVAYDGERAIELFPGTLQCHLRNTPGMPGGVVPEEYLLLFGMRWSEAFEKCTFSELEHQGEQSVFLVTLNEAPSLTARITVDTQEGTVLKKEVFAYGKGQTYWEYSDFREVAPGFVFPFQSAEMERSLSTEEPSGPDTVIRVIKVEDLELNAEIPHGLFGPDIPVGYTVVDFVRRIQYVSGTHAVPEEVVDSLVSEPLDVAAGDLLVDIAVQSEPETSVTADDPREIFTPNPPASNRGLGATHVASFVLGILAGALGLTALRWLRNSPGTRCTK